jgi:hypothetical protein
LKGRRKICRHGNGYIRKAPDVIEMRRRRNCPLGGGLVPTISHFPRR